MPLNDERRAALARELRRVVARVDPAWTDSGSHDPGVTILQLLAYALADLGDRKHALSHEARVLAREAATLAQSLDLGGDGGTGDDCGAGLRRVAYFAGQLLDADDLRAEQDYLLHRLNRRNRLLVGSGIVVGLEVTVHADAKGARVVIAPGLAFDPQGREICVETACELALPAAGTALLARLSYRERPCRYVLVAANAAADATTDAAADAATRPTRIVETFDATLASAPDADAVTIARLLRVRGRWKIDPTFEACRLRGE